ncbi:MAG: zinc ribbon domain-containing protein [Candidatus Heimdallarchaeota archaeon]|nr:zinc ribbon domain-containing protein [Candidatus Heimdallarchaeota archaeon]
MMNISQEVLEREKKRKQLYGILRIATFIFLLGDLFGFSYVLGIPTFFIGVVLMFTRGLIVNKIYGPSYAQQQKQMMQQQQFAQQQYTQQPNQDPLYSSNYHQPAAQEFVMEIKFCESCGTQNDLDSNFCIKCGEKLL